MSVLIISLILEGYRAITEMENNLLFSAKVPAKRNKEIKSEIWDTSLMMEAQLPLSFPQSKQQVRYKCWDDSSRKTANGVSSKVDLEYMMRTPSPTIAAGSAAPQSLSFPSCFIWTE